MGFAVGLWNYLDWDVDALAKTGATFTIMNGYLQGRLADDQGADMLLASARETVAVGKRLDVQRYNLHGTGLGDGGIPIRQHESTSDAMWLKARDTLSRIADLGEELGVVFTLENLKSVGSPWLSLWLDRRRFGASQ